MCCFYIQYGMFGDFESRVEVSAVCGISCNDGYESLNVGILERIAATASINQRSSYVEVASYRRRYGGSSGGDRGRGSDIHKPIGRGWLLVAAGTYRYRCRFGRSTRHVVSADDAEAASTSRVLYTVRASIRADVAVAAPPLSVCTRALGELDAVLLAVGHRAAAVDALLPAFRQNGGSGWVDRGSFN